MPQPVQGKPAATRSEPFGGVFGGLVQSRLYQGSLTVSTDTPTGSQDFVFRAHPASLAQVLQSKGQGCINLFNGSSYASFEMLRLLSGIASGKRTPILPQGALGLTPEQRKEQFKFKGVVASQ